MPAIGFQHKHIANVSISRVVRDYAGKAYLLPITIHAKAKRILDGAGHNLARDSLGPIRLRQKTVNDIQINSFFISTDNKLAFAMLCDLCSRRLSLCCHSSVAFGSYFLALQLSWICR